MRINKLLSNYGYCSRKEVRRLIEEKRIIVNGKLCEQGQWVEESDDILLDGEKVEKKEKIYLALKETRNAFSEDSEMYKTITKAMQCIDDGKSFRETFDVIEEKYFNSYVNQLHSYLILGEQEGGDIVYESLSHIDFQEWQTDTYSFQIAKDKLKKQNGIFAAMALCMTLFIFHFFPSDIMDPLLALQEFQIYTFIYFEIVLVAFIVVKAFLTGKWIKEDE